MKADSFEARENMRFKATHDALTSLFNRGAIMELLGREISRSRRERVPAAILRCDVDHFKDINDTYGHLIGDEVYRKRPGVFSYRCALMITCGGTVVKSS